MYVVGARSRVARLFFSFFSFFRFPSFSLAALKTQYPGADVAGAKGPPKGGVPVMPGAGGPSSSPQQNGPPANAPWGPGSPQQQWQNPPHQNWQQGFVALARNALLFLIGPSS